MTAHQAAWGESGRNTSNIRRFSSCRWRQTRSYPVTKFPFLLSLRAIHSRANQKKFPKALQCGARSTSGPNPAPPCLCHVCSSRIRRPRIIQSAYFLPWKKALIISPGLMQPAKQSQQRRWQCKTSNSSCVWRQTTTLKLSERSPRDAINYITNTRSRMSTSKDCWT